MLLVSFGLAGEYADDFSTDQGAWSAGGAVTEGVLRVTDADAVLGVLDPGDTASFGLTTRVRLATQGRLAFGPVGAEVTQTVQPGDGSLRLGTETLPLPMSHLGWVPDEAPVLEAGVDAWEAGGLVHAEVVRDDDGTWLLYYTGYFGPPGYAYRQIGLATSPDAVTWTRYAGNPVLTIDYSADVDGVHVHMPTVTRGPDETWHMFYACYQNNVGNRLCHATSPDGYAWNPEGVALDKGAEGEFDEGSLRMPDVWIAPDGEWHLWYDGTDPEQHYGPTGYATSADGWTWTRHGEILDAESALQGLSVVETPFGLDAFYNRNDVFFHASARPEEPSEWTETGLVLEKGWAWWNDGYIQAPTVALDGTTWRMWFNGYTYTDGFERLGTAHTEPIAGEWLDVRLDWNGTTLTVEVDGAVRALALTEPAVLHIAAEGTAELDDVVLTWEDAPADTGDSGLPTGDDSPPPADTQEHDTAPPDGTPEEASGSCGCQTAPGLPGMVGLGFSAVLWRLRRGGRGALLTSPFAGTRHRRSHERP